MDLAFQSRGSMSVSIFYRLYKLKSPGMPTKRKCFQGFTVVMFHFPWWIVRPPYGLNTTEFTLYFPVTWFGCDRCTLWVDWYCFTFEMTVLLFNSHGSWLLSRCVCIYVSQQVRKPFCSTVMPVFEWWKQKAQAKRSHLKAQQPTHTDWCGGHNKRAIPWQEPRDSNEKGKVL